MSQLSIQYASDLHLSSADQYDFENIIIPVADILVLAGDLGDPQSDVYHLFLAYLAQLQKNNKFKIILFILGNHEYYYSNLIDGYQYLANLCLQYDIIILDNKTYKYGNYLFLGTTFWSYLPAYLATQIKKSINDYKKIENISPEIITTIHNNNVRWLSSQLDRSEHTHMIKIVITHHAPLKYRTYHPKYENKITNFAYASNYPQLVNKCHIWIFGHTHYTTAFYYADTLLLSNPRGYKSEKLDYDNKKMIII